MAVEESASIAILCDFSIEKVIVIFIHLSRVTFEEHTHSSLKQAITCENHLVDTFLSSNHRQNEHIVRRCVTWSFKGFDSDAACQKILNNLPICDLLIASINRLVYSADDTNIWILVDEALVVRGVIPMFMRR